MRELPARSANRHGDRGGGERPAVVPAVRGADAPGRGSRPLEGVFGTLKRSYGYWRTRYVGLEKNIAEAMFKVMAYNLRRTDGVRGARAGAIA